MTILCFDEMYIILVICNYKVQNNVTSFYLRMNEITINHSTCKRSCSPIAFNFLLTTGKIGQLSVSAFAPF